MKKNYETVTDQENLNLDRKYSNSPVIKEMPKFYKNT